MKHVLKLIVLVLIIGHGIVNAQVEASTQVRELEPFDRIVAGNGINVKLYDNELEEAEVKVQGVPLENVITEVVGKTLKVRMKVSVKSDVSVIVKISYKTLNSISAVTGAHIETGREMLVDKIVLDASTGGVIKAELVASEVETSAKAASEVHLFGKTEKLYAKAMLGGLIKAYKLQSKVAEVTASGGSTVEVYVMEDANLKAILGGDVKVKGNPYEVKKKESTGGVVRILNKTEYGKDLIRDK